MKGHLDFPEDYGVSVTGDEGQIRVTPRSFGIGRELQGARLEIFWLA